MVIKKWIPTIQVVLLMIISGAQEPSGPFQMTIRRSSYFAHPKSSLPSIFTSQSLPLLASNISPLSFLSNCWCSCLWYWFLFQCFNTGIHCLQPPSIYKRTQHSMCKGKMFISRGLGDGVIITVRLYAWSILAFCMSINISHLDVLLMWNPIEGCYCAHILMS